VAHYAGLPGLAMALVTGSAARGLADEASDLDLVLYWEEVDRDRLRAAGRLDALGARRLFGVATEEGFFEKYVCEGRFVDVESVRLDVLELAVGALTSGGAMPDGLAKVAAGLRDARAVAGPAELEKWRARFVYSDEVAVAEVGVRGRRLVSPSALFELTYVRGDVLSFAARLSRVLLDAVGLLAAANRVFIPVDDPKWVPWHLGRLRHVPPNVVERIDLALREPSPVSMIDIDGLLTEVLDIVDEHVPGADTRAARFATSLRPRP
jgi:Nucleotidyltransferase domain